MQYPKALLATVFSVLLLSCAIFFGLREPVGGVYDRALELYEQQKYPQARAAISGFEDRLLSAPDGCNLVVSILAEGRDWHQLEIFSRKCLDHNSGLSIAYDGLAKSLVERGQVDEAIQVFQTLTPHHPRYHFAFAGVSFLAGDLQNGREQVLLGIKAEKTWEPWVRLCFKWPLAASDPQFVRRLLLEITPQSQRSPDLVARLLEIARLLEVEPAIVDEFAKKHGQANENT